MALAASWRGPRLRGRARQAAEGRPGGHAGGLPGDTAGENYLGVALGTSILVDFGKQRKVLGQVVSGVLSHVPSLADRYSLVSTRCAAPASPPLALPLRGSQ